eukprot:5347472-Alexandrium_andersonii.AAC.1
METRSAQCLVHSFWQGAPRRNTSTISHAPQPESAHSAVVGQAMAETTENAWLRTVHLQTPFTTWRTVKHACIAKRVPKLARRITCARSTDDV